MATVRSLKNSIYFIEWSYNESSPTICDALFRNRTNCQRKAANTGFLDR